MQIDGVQSCHDQNAGEQSINFEFRCKGSREHTSKKPASKTGGRCKQRIDVMNQEHGGQCGAERAYTKSVVLAAGVAVRGSAGALAPVIRPFPNASSSGLRIAGHFHAAAFSYRPVQRGQIDLKASIKSLFEGQVLEGILHLLSDDRAVSGSGQSELIRGACWIAPISTITAEGAQV